MERLIDRLPDDVERLAHTLLDQACDRGLSLATAESCTGGLIAAILTDVEGTSHAFERGFVVYTIEAKAGLLGIPRSLIDTHGVVSREIALAMVQGALNHSAADIDLAVTGFAGPAGAGKEAGLVHFGAVRRGRQPFHREAHFGERGRGAVRIESVRVGLAMMIEALGN